jgi:predicted RNase H-like HicB family nuclease
MLLQYIEAALESARYELFQEDGTFYAEIPLCPGVYANEPTLEGCRRELASVLEDWILVRVARGLPLPEITGLKLEVGREEAA